MSTTDGTRAGVGIVRAGEGPALWMGGDTYTVKASAESTAGALGLIEASIPPGSGPPPHRHTNEDEAFYLIDGSLEITVEDVVHRAAAGDFVFLPRGLQHSFRNTGIVAAKALIMVTPGGFEHFFSEVGAPAQAGAQCPPPGPDDIARLVSTSPRYGVHIAVPPA
jgi:quercetin dioxygenase-like cupin family protein